MKKISITAIALLFVTSISLAQQFRRFKVGVGLGYAVENFNNMGGLFSIEPAYRLNDFVQVGVRVENSFMSEYFHGSDAVVTKQSLTISSVSLNGQYYLSEYYVRPFVGLGAGLFSHSGVLYQRSEVIETTPLRNTLGFYPRIGVDIGHLTLAVDYNIIPTTGDEVGGARNYFGIRAAFAIGGGVGARKPFNSY